MKYLLLSLKALVTIPILLFAVMTFLAGAYLQTFSLILIVLALFYWPWFKASKRRRILSRAVFIGFVLILQFTAFKSGPKQSIYGSPSLQDELYSIYDSKVALWPASTEQIFLETEYGKVHVLGVGDKEAPPLLMFHAASMGAHSWAENLEPLLGHYRIYAIDNIGEGNLSELKDALVFPTTPKEIADLYADIANQLGVERSPVFGASNGGYIAQVYAYYHPDKVESISLFGPMGLTPLSGRSILMLGAASMFPLEFVREKVMDWAFGDDNYCHETYGDWFDIILKATIPSIAQPIPMTDQQKKAIDVPVLLFLGTSDPIVGDAEIARAAAEYYPNIKIFTLNSGHLIAVEHREFINQRVKEFLHL